MSAYNKFAVESTLAALEAMLDVLAVFGHQSDMDNVCVPDGNGGYAYNAFIAVRGLTVGEDGLFVEDNFDWTAEKPALELDKIDMRPKTCSTCYFYEHDEPCLIFAGGREKCKVDPGKFYCAKWEKDGTA